MTFAPAPSRSPKGRPLRALALSLGTVWLIACLAALPTRQAFAAEASAQHAKAATR
jgi:hypothetical protein